MNNDDYNYQDQDNGDEHEGFNPLLTPLSAGLSGFLLFVFLFVFIGSIAQYFLFGIELTESNIDIYRLFTIASQILFILLPALIMTKLIYSDVTRFLRIKIPKVSELLLYGVGILILIPLVQSIVNIQEYLLTELAKGGGFWADIKSGLDLLNTKVQEAFQVLLSTKSVFDVISIFIVVAIDPAVCEEVLFRGFIQRSFELRFNKFFAALIAALLFGAIHFNPYGFVPLVILGLYFGFAAYKSESIIIPFILHFLNNVINIFIFYMFETDEQQIAEVGNADDLTLYLATFFGSLFLMIILVFVINRYKKKNEVGKDDLS